MINGNIFSKLILDKTSETIGDDKTNKGNIKRLPYGCHLRKIEKRRKPMIKHMK